MDVHVACLQYSLCCFGHVYLHFTTLTVYKFIAIKIFVKETWSIKLTKYHFVTKMLHLVAILFRAWDRL